MRQERQSGVSSSEAGRDGGTSRIYLYGVVDALEARNLPESGVACRTIRFMR